MAGMELTFLGTASAYPTPTRGVSCAVLKYDGDCWMFDCGEGSQIQLMRSAIKPGRISKIFITHLHGDHLFGLPGLMCTINISGGAGTDDSQLLQVYGPVGLRKFIRLALGLSRSQIGYNYIVHELQTLPHQDSEEFKDWVVDHTCGENEPLHPNELQGTTIHPDENNVWHVFEDKKVIIKASCLVHKVASFGFAIEELPLPGKLDIEKLRSFGIKPGPICSELKAGKSVTSPSGDTVRPEDVVGCDRPGRKVVIMGDSSDSQQMAELCRSADVLVHETTLENEMEEDARSKGHSTPAMVGQFAKDVGVEKLVLTHYSQRYRAANTKAEAVNGEFVTVSKLEDQAREAFGRDNVQAAEDFTVIVIPAKK